ASTIFGVHYPLRNFRICQTVLRRRLLLFCLNFFGSQEPADTAVFDDVTVVKTMRLIRVIRRLRELQRLAAKGGENV
ncbi:hypothetical protein, partial [Klebsiella oxytoca]|uniref:hypothetical protein n=1 Tax=Klebsiella oxytoca TaxID=571 RepID=UPI001CA31FFF